MLHLHLIGLLTFEFLTLIAAVFLAIYIKKQQLDNWFRHLSKIILVALHVIIVATILHAVIHHFAGHGNMTDHHNMMEHHQKHH